MSNAHTSKSCRRSWWLLAGAKLAALLVFSSGAGCSLIGVRAGPKTANTDAGPALCTTSAWRPFVDTLGMTAFAAGTVVGIDNDAHVLTALGTGGAVIFATSLLYGASTVGDCDAQAERDLRRKSRTSASASTAAVPVPRAAPGAATAQASAW